MDVWLRDAGAAPGDAYPANRLADLCLRNRGESAPLDRSLQALLRPDSLKGVGAAAERLADAIRGGERIAILSDYDCDGATGAAVMMDGLRLLGAANPAYVVPNRLRHGYGLTPASVDLLKPLQPDVMVTVDNGVCSFDGAEAMAASLPGCDVIITDHHLPAKDGRVPVAHSIVNPNQVGCEFPSKSLCGCGVAFYLIAAVRRRMLDKGWLKEPPPLVQLLDLVALATVADVVPLDRNNRILVAAGLDRINKGACRPGITALLSLGNRRLGATAADDLAFAVAPRINAAGRLGDMRFGIACLLETDPTLAMEKASALDQNNRDRREMEKAMMLDALDQVDAIKEGSPSACLHHDSWHEGVVGIVASRVKEETEIPVICFANSGEGDRIKGSARSVKGCHIKHVLDEMNATQPGLMVGYGGHAMAAGVELRKQDLERFAELFDASVARHVRQDDLTRNGVVADEVLTGDQHFTMENAQALDAAGPWGQDFPEPQFAGTFDVVSQRILQAKHARLRLRPLEAYGTVDAIAFNCYRRDEEAKPFDSSIHCAFKLKVNHWQGRESLQMVVERIESAKEPMNIRRLEEALARDGAAADADGADHEDISPAP